MWEDPIVAEVRAVRDAHARKFNYDLDAIFADIKNSERARQGTSRRHPTRVEKPLVKKGKHA